MSPPSPNPARDEASNWAIIKRLLALTWHYKLGVLMLLAFQVVLLALGLAGLGFIGLGIDFVRSQVIEGALAPRWPLGLEPPADWTSLRTMTMISLAVLVAALVRALLNYLTQSTQNRLTQGRIVVDLRTQVYEKLQRLSFRFFDGNASSSLINRVTSDVQALRMFIDEVLMQGVIMAVSLIAYVIFMFQVHVPLTIVCLAATPLLWAAAMGFSRIIQPAYAVNRELVDALVQRLIASVRGVQVIKAFGCEALELERFDHSNDRLRSQQQTIFRRVSVFVPTVGFLSQASLIALLGYGGYLAISGEIPIGTGLVVFAAILQQFSGQVASVANLANSMHQSLRGARRVFEVLDVPLEIQSPQNPLRPQPIAGRVEFENVWFDHGDNPVLQDITFTVEAGESVAIVGPTGSGKTALTSLIPRFYDPTSGSVRIDGIDLREFDLDHLRRQIGIVFQECFLFSTTVAENIAFGIPDATQEQIEAAAKIASAHEFITDLPDGYGTILGESGVGLSGGQRQRLAIARAVLLDPPILLFDDATAAIDSEMESEIANAINGAMAGRTTFIVAHRPAMLRRADRIVVLEHGRVEQYGTHEELMRSRGYYSDAVALQSAAST